MLTRQQFIEKYYPYAKRITAGTGIFPAVMLAQMVIESQAKVGTTYYPGQSQLSKMYNNFFGIKADKSWKGESVKLDTGEVFNGKSVIIKDAFRVYQSPEESMRDYVDFLKKNPRYKSAGVFDAKTIAEQAQALLRAGYATAPSYAALVTSVGNSISSFISEIEKKIKKNLPIVSIICFAALFF